MQQLQRPPPTLEGEQTRTDKQGAQVTRQEHTRKKEEHINDDTDTTTHTPEGDQSTLDQTVGAGGREASADRQPVDGESNREQQPKTERDGDTVQYGKETTSRTKQQIGTRFTQVRATTIKTRMTPDERTTRIQ